MKRIMLLLILTLIAVAFIGCANSDKQVSVENPAPQPAAAEVTESAPAEAASNDVGQSSGTDIIVSLGETGENMSLPENFPKDVFPLPEDANIINVNDNPDANTTSIIFKTGMKYDEATAYCHENMKGGTIAFEDKQDSGYLLMGNKDKYSISASVSKYDGENISILVSVTPQ